MCGPFRITPSVSLLLLRAGGARVAGTGPMIYLQATMLIIGGQCFLWYAIGDDLRNRRNSDFALTSTPPSCEPEVHRADIHDASDISTRTGTWRRVAGGAGRSRDLDSHLVSSIGSTHSQRDAR
jgi:hypothetical protein